MKKNTYTPEEIDELKEWFDTHQDTIPQDMYIEESTYTPNLKETIKRLFEQAYIYCSNPKMLIMDWVRYFQRLRNAIFK